jgi:hypothetical protein
MKLPDLDRRALRPRRLAAGLRCRQSAGNQAGHHDPGRSPQPHGRTGLHPLERRRHRHLGIQPPTGRRALLHDQFRYQDIVSRFDQVLNEANYGPAPGMSKDDVRRLLRSTGSKTGFANLREEIWEWRIEGEMPLEETYFMVHFDTGHGAVKKSSKRIEPKA